MAFKRHKMKVFELTNSADSYEAAHHEPPHMDLHCLSATFLNFQYIIISTD